MASPREKHALVMFNTMMLLRRAGTISSNLEFRQNLIEAYEGQFFITRAAAAALYNTVRKTALAIDPSIKLGKDPVRVRKPAPARRRSSDRSDERHVHVVGLSGTRSD